MREKTEYSCRWDELVVESEFNPDKGGKPVMLCHHPEGSEFCDYWETADEMNCPLSEYAVPFHEVEIRQHLEMTEDGT